jgi:hypothetical protein
MFSKLSVFFLITFAFMQNALSNNFIPSGTYECLDSSTASDGSPILFKEVVQLKNEKIQGLNIPYFTRKYYAKASNSTEYKLGSVYTGVGNYLEFSGSVRMVTGMPDFIMIQGTDGKVLMIDRPCLKLN